MFKKSYDLKAFNEITEDSNFSLKYWMQENDSFKILKYNKDKLNYDNILFNGLARSIIYKDNKLISYSPAKSLNLDHFKSLTNNNLVFAEEFIEGTMINLFYDKKREKWEIATKSSIGGKMFYVQGRKTFGELFWDAFLSQNLNLEEFNKNYSYSLVFQHPENKYILPILEKRIYLIAIYQIEDDKVFELGRNDYPEIGDFLSKFYFPCQFKFENYEYLENLYGSNNTDINLMGIMIKDESGLRTKIRNPNYEYLKSLKGNCSKNQFHYYTLRKLNKVKEFLNYFPDYYSEFGIYRKQIHIFTRKLYQYYSACYIKKEKPLADFPSQYRIHIYNLHQEYLNIREKGGYINPQKVQDYVNNIDPAKLMYTINFDLRKKNIDFESSKEVENNLEIEPLV